MQSKSLLIAIAAFAVTTTGVQAYGGTKLLEKAGVNKEQIQAFEEARELKHSGDLRAARDRLLEAGVDEETLKTVHRLGKHNHLLEELNDVQREAFQVARQSNDRETMQAILDEAGIDSHSNFHKRRIDN